ncbi:MAG: glutathione S-transferase, partial [Alphaproteobacteria bacterium]|nr:glutathione S-transferase [Alphaproteobacteria bacterium]
MRLSSSPASPFGRMIKIAAHVVGVMDQITVVATETTDPDDPVRKLNPLGKIPVLVADDMALYDSRVILEYLDHRAG